MHRRYMKDGNCEAHKSITNDDWAISNLRMRSNLCRRACPTSVPIWFAIILVFLSTFFFFYTFNSFRATRRVYERRDNFLGLSTRELQLADRLRDLQDQNMVLQGQLGLSQKQLMSYLSIKGGRRTLNHPGDGDEEDDDNGPCPGQINSVPKCEPIHVTFVCAGYKNVRSMATLVKSILFYRRNPIHFHLVSDDIAIEILKTLFKTWNIAQAEFTYYSTTLVEKEVGWIPNKHYSGIYGLLKLTLPQILPKHLRKTIVLDTDLVFAADIVELWGIFQDFSDDACLGLVENQSDWYLPGKLWKEHNPWPALGRGFNTGVILMHLERMRQQNWKQLWRTIAEKDLLTHFSTSLADQDIFNAVIKDHPDLVQKLPCQWNLQLSDHGKSEDLCFGSKPEEEKSVLGRRKKLKVIHFNSPQKLRVKTRFAEYFRNHYITFQQYDGNLLRKFLNFDDCNSLNGVNIANDGFEQNSETLREDDSCYDMKIVQTKNFRTHLYYMDFFYENEDLKNSSDVTWVTQLSMDRLHMIERLAKEWEGPISLALYLSDAESTQFVSFVEGSEILKSRQNIAYHVVFKEGVFYPINYIRNVALKNAQTEFVFLSDIDFIPGPDVYSNLRKAVQTSQPTFAKDKKQNKASYDLNRTAYVVPAFETQRYRLDSFPKTKVDVLNLLDLGTLLTFRYHLWSEGHQATNFPKWKTATKPYRIKWEPHFEPYVVVRRGVHLYDQRFVGFGWNKVSHIMQLEAQNYQFVVLPNVFIIHMPHAPSLDIAKFRTSKTHRRCLDILKEEFITELNQNYTKHFNSM